MARKERILVLSVDRDDDVGKKAGIKGPVFGREAVLKAASALGLADPSDSDSNAMFEAVRLHDSMKKTCEEAISHIRDMIPDFQALEIDISSMERHLQTARELFVQGQYHLVMEELKLSTAEIEKAYKKMQE